MKYIKFYIVSTVKWIIYNSLLLSIVLFCIFQLYGNINFQYYNDNVEILKNIGLYGNTNQFNMNQITKLEKNNKYKNINIFLELPVFDHSNDEYVENIKFSIMYGDKDNILKVGNLIDNKSSGKIIVSPEYFSKNGYALLDKIKINGKEFTIVGVSNYKVENSFILSYDDYKKLDLNVHSFTVRANDTLIKNNINEFINYIKDVFNDKTLKVDHPNNNLSNMYDEILFSIIIFILSLLNMYNLYKYTLFKKAKFINIMLLSGLDKVRIIFSEIITIIFTFIIGNIISIISHKLFNKLILNNLFNINNNIMYSENYLYVFLFFIIFYLLSMILVLRNNFTIYISKNIKESNIWLKYLNYQKNLLLKD